MNYLTTSSGSHATAMGYQAKAQAMASVAMGRFNIGGGNPTSWVTSDPIFEIGIGNATNDTKNALTVLKNGKVGLGTATPEEMLHVEGTIEVDQRIQANDAGGLELATDDGTVRLQIEDSGEVGIGTVTPNAKLHVLGEARFESAGGGSKIIIDGSTGLAQVEFQDDGVYGAGIGYSLDNSRIFLYHGGGNVFIKNGNLGVGIEPTHKIHVTGGAYCDGGAWVNGSSRTLKENFLRVDNRDVLARLSALPVTEWNYISEGQYIRHMGPMAEDFHAAFGLGHDNVSISTVDLAGVTVAAVQALKADNDRLAASNESLRAVCADLEKRQHELEIQIARLNGLLESLAAHAGSVEAPR